MSDKKAKKKLAKGTVVHSFKINHPKHGWCGGDESDRWYADESYVDKLMTHSEYETEKVSRTVGEKSKK